MNQIWLAFLTGLTTGGLSCLAVQGGLLASAVAPKDATNDSSLATVSVSGVGMFLFAKFIAYAILGFFLGLLGSSLTLTPKLLGVAQIFAGVFMLITALRIANVHPVFRYFVIQPPRWAYRLLKQTSRGQSWFAPAMLGFLTVLIPCGVTQATMVIAVASASPLLGALIMGAFVLGTSPVFFVLGATVTQLLKRRVFSYVASGLVLIFAIYSINGGIGLTGSFFTLQNIYRAAVASPQELAYGGQVAGVTNGVQDVSIVVGSNGYSASVTNLKAGVPVDLKLISENVNGCARAFTIPDLNITKVLPVTGETSITFTPRNTGQLAYSCAMGMYTGSFNVIP